MAEVDKYSRGIVKDRNRLYWVDFKQMPAPYPPIQEQTRIADRIDLRVTLIDTSVRRIKRHIDLLREYRARLISDVVTGKLDVRGVSARLPDYSADPVSCAESDVMSTIDTETSSVSDTGVKEIET